jgi:hypothetical protein
MIRSFKQFFLEAYSKDEMRVANLTSRARGAIGAKAITPRYVQTIAQPHHQILDFGAGAAAAHAETLRGAGLQVTAHEFGSNVNERHDRKALDRQYDLVYASNVLNTQSSPQMMARTLDQIRGAVRGGGGFVGNYPQSPRKSALKPAEVEAMLQARFKNVKRVGGTKAAPLWHAHD